MWFQLHCLKSDRIRSFPGQHLSALGQNLERYGRSISPYSDRMRENTDQKYSAYGYFSCGVSCKPRGSILTRHLSHSGVFIVDLEQISHIVLVFSPLTSRKLIQAGYLFCRKASS